MRPTRMATRQAAMPYRAAVPYMGAAKGGAVALSWDALRLILFLNVVLGISRLHAHFPVVAALRPLMLTVAVAGVFIVLNPGSVDFRRLYETWPAKVILGLAVMACLSAPFGISMGRSATFLINNYSKVIIGTLLLLAATRSVRDLATFVWAYVLGCGIISFLAVFVFGVEDQGPANVAYRLERMFTFDANDLSCMLLIGLALTLLMFRASTGMRKWLCVVILVLIGVAFARAGSRGGLLGLVAVGGYLLFSLNEVSPVKRMMFVAAVFGGLVIGAPQGYWAQMKTLVNPTEDFNWSAENGRKQLALRGLGYMYTHPVFGVGIGNFPMAEGVISEKAANNVPGTGIRWAAAHNSYIQAGAEMGVPGMILYSALVLGGFVAMVRLRRRLPAHWARGHPEERFLYLSTTYFPVAILGFVVSSAFVSLAYALPSHFLAVLMAGLYSSVHLHLKRGPVPVASGRAPRARRRPSRAPGVPSTAGAPFTASSQEPVYSRRPPRGYRRRGRR